MKHVKIEVTDEMKRFCALSCMQMCLEKISECQGISFEEAFSRFVNCGCYDDIMDLEMELWGNGPGYLYEWYTNKYNRRHS